MSYFAELKLARLTPCAQYFHIRICGGVLFWFPKLAELIFSGSHLSPRFRTSLEPVLSTGKRNSSLVHGWLDHLRRRLRLYRLPWKRLTSLLLEHCTASTLSPNRKRPPFILWITQTKIKCFEWFFMHKIGPEEISAEKYYHYTLWTADLMPLIKFPLFFSSKIVCILNRQLFHHMPSKISDKQNCRKC